MRSSYARKLGTTIPVTATLVLPAADCDEDPQLGSSNRGSGSETQDTTVENAFIVPTPLPGRCAIQLDTGAKMRFSVTNSRPTETERLVGVSSNAGANAAVTADINIPAKSTIGFDQPSAPSVDAGGTVSAYRCTE